MHPGSNKRIAGLLFMSLLAGCGDGSPPSAVIVSTAAFRDFATANAAADTVVPTELTALEKTEVASRSRQWSVDTLVTRDTGFPENALAIPPLYFARAEAVAAAAYGTTLAQLRGVYPAPSSPRVADALMRGISRTISAGTATRIATSFMDAVTARATPDTWSALVIQPLSDAQLAAQPNLRLSINDEFTASLAWPQATVFNGVFAAENGGRLETRMVRITGPLVTATDADMDAAALALPQGRWLLRITPTGSLRAWSAASVEAAIAKLTAFIAAATGQTLLTGDLVVPMDVSYSALGDVRGMDEAQSQVMADLRGLDGHGGDYVEFPGSSAVFTLNASGGSVQGSDSVSFIFSPLNRFSDGGGGEGSGVILTAYPLPESNTCGKAVDLRPSYLALVDEIGRVELLARFMAVDGAVEGMCPIVLPPSVVLITP